MSSDKEQNTLELEAENNEVIRRDNRYRFEIFRRVVKVVSVPTLLVYVVSFNTTLEPADWPWLVKNAAYALFCALKMVSIVMFVLCISTIFRAWKQGQLAAGELKGYRGVGGLSIFVCLATSSIGWHWRLDMWKESNWFHGVVLWLILVSDTYLRSPSSEQNGAHKSDSTMNQERSEVELSEADPVGEDARDKQRRLRVLIYVLFGFAFVLLFWALWCIVRNNSDGRQLVAISGAETVDKMVVLFDVMCLYGAFNTWRVGKLTWAGGKILRAPIILVPLNLGNYYLQRYVEAQYMSE